MDRHLILLRHQTVAEAIAGDNYTVPDHAQAIAAAHSDAEGYLRALIDADLLKDACDFLAYAMHRRAGVWWGYEVVTALRKELALAERDAMLKAEEAEKKEAEKKEKKEGEEAPEGAGKEAQAAEAAAEGTGKPDAPESAAAPGDGAQNGASGAKASQDAEPESFAAFAERFKANPKDFMNPAAEADAFERIKAELQAQLDYVNSLIPPEFREIWNKEFHKQCEERLGKIDGDPFEMLAEMARNYEPTNSPRQPDFSEAEIVKKTAAKAEEVKQELDESRKVFEMMNPAAPKGVAEGRLLNAMDAVWSWIALPQLEQTKAASVAGNACADKPEGMLALTAFWSFGNLDLTGKMFIPTPPGLAGNGLSGVLTQVIVHPGGTRKPGERLKDALELGLEVAMGRSTWEEGLKLERAPHRMPAGAADRPAAAGREGTPSPERFRMPARFK